MLTIEPTGAILGATIHGLDLSRDVSDDDFPRILQALGRQGGQGRTQTKRDDGGDQGRAPAPAVTSISAQRRADGARSRAGGRGHGRKLLLAGCVAGGCGLGAG